MAWLARQEAPTGGAQVMTVGAGGTPQKSTAEIAEESAEDTEISALSALFSATSAVK
jgi:hypothetical protein